MEAGDLASAARRLLVCANEDVGLAYPMIIPIVKAAVDTENMAEYCAAQVYIANYGEKARMAALELCAALRHEGIRADIDHVGRSMKAQFKYADKAGAAYVVTIGEDELDRGEIRLRQMESHEEKPFALTDAAGIAAFVKGQSNAE